MCPLLCALFPASHPRGWSGLPDAGRAAALRAPPPESSDSVGSMAWRLASGRAAGAQWVLFAFHLQTDLWPSLLSDQLDPLQRVLFWAGCGHDLPSTSVALLPTWDLKGGRLASGSPGFTSWFCLSPACPQPASQASRFIMPQRPRWCISKRGPKASPPWGAKDGERSRGCLTRD